MKIIVSGATGFIGEALCGRLQAAGHRVVALTRDLDRARRRLGPSVDLFRWDGPDAGRWERTLEDADAIVNLAGAPIAAGRWTAARKQLLVQSRVTATRRLVDALSLYGRRPVVFVSASGIGFYGASDTALFDETGPKGTGFLADLSAAWEAEAQRADTFGARVVRVRIGMVLERDGGALPKMLLPFYLGMGGPILPGTQWVSWIHRTDLIELIRWAVSTPTVSGPLNAVAPGAVQMTQLCHSVGRALHRPCWLPVPQVAVRVGLGELGTLLTTGQRVDPARARAQGFVFRYPDVESAMQAILRRGFHEASRAPMSGDAGAAVGKEVER